MDKNPVYLDYNATTPIAPEVIEAVTSSLRNYWANPSSKYNIGIRVKEETERNRSEIARMIHAKNPADVIFTSGGTEANKLAIESAVFSALSEGMNGLPHVITSNVEHVSVSKVLHYLKSRGVIELVEIPVSQHDGRLPVDAVMKSITKRTVLITVMHANNETGIIMPISELGKGLNVVNADRCNQNLPRIYFHTDAAQSVGKIRVDVEELGVDYLTVVGHKFYGTKIGALVALDAGKGTPIMPTFLGGGQENGFRAGTENAAMIAGLGMAAKLVSENLAQYSKVMEERRNVLKSSLKVSIPGLRVNFELQYCLPNTLSIAVPEGLTGAIVLERLSDTVFASLGAACHTFSTGSSSILTDSGLTMEQALRTIRLSVGRDTSVEDITVAVNALSRACEL